MQFEYSSTDQDKFSLHDCRPSSAELIDERLTFRFPDGIFCEGYSNDWPNAGKAEVEFTIDTMRNVTIYLFVDSDGQTVREECTLTKLLQKINENEWELEFAYRYNGYQNILYQCWIWEVPGPRCHECELWIGTKEDVVFRWDPPAAGMN